jgi:hypothetical protein
LIAFVAENRRREDAAGVAVDAGRIDEKVARNVCIEPQCCLCHADWNARAAR